MAYTRMGKNLSLVGPITSIHSRSKLYQHTIPKIMFSFLGSISMRISKWKITHNLLLGVFNSDVVQWIVINKVHIPMTMQEVCTKGLLHKQYSKTWTKSNSRKSLILGTKCCKIISNIPTPQGSLDWIDWSLSSLVFKAMDLGWSSWRLCAELIHIYKGIIVKTSLT